ncbi:MAG: class D sortase [Lachnospiraceae bacterium]|nr:class D sortase [Lachnospiraceae bacterium]
MKNKLLFIIGGLIIVVGIGVILYPIINRAISASKQRELMEQVKEDILNNIPAEPAASETNTAEVTPKPQTGDVAGTDGSTGVEGINLNGDSFMNISETEDSGSESYDRSRLSGQKVLGIISCDKIDLVYAIVEGTDDDNIGVAIGHFKDSVAIGAEGNCALAGHNGGTYGRYFGDIKDLEKGDPVILTDLNGYEYTYNVTDVFVVEPEDVYVVKDLGKSGKFLTMVTCTQHGTKRLIVRAQCTTDPVLSKYKH